MSSFPYVRDEMNRKITRAIPTAQTTTIPQAMACALCLYAVGASLNESIIDCNLRPRHVRVSLSSAVYACCVVKSLQLPRNVAVTLVGHERVIVALDVGICGLDNALRVYAHVTPTVQHEAADVRDGMFGTLQA